MEIKGTFDAKRFFETMAKLIGDKENVQITVTVTQEQEEEKTA